MRRMSVGRGLLVAMLVSALLLVSSEGEIQGADNSSPVTFETKDGVVLHGTFFPGKSAKVKEEPTILLLHSYGSHSHADGWDNLAEKLQEKGFSVLSFDFRGHGKSTTVKAKTFWSFTYNQQKVRNYIPAKPRESIGLKEFNIGYAPHLVNDIAAAKSFLDEKNDSAECNSKALVLIGAEGGAALGTLWMASEWHRHRASINDLVPARPFVTDVDETEPEGRDQYAAIWLTISSNLGGRNIDGSLRTMLKYVGQEKKVPMAFLYGEKDEGGNRQSESYLKSIQGNNKPATLPFTAKTPVKTNMTGSKILRQELGTISYITDKYLPALREKVPPPNWVRRDTERASYAWTFPPRVWLVAKTKDKKSLEPIPIERFLSP